MIVTDLRKIIKTVIWHDKLKQPISCIEKIKVMNENLEEFISLTQDLLDDGIIMGIDKIQIQHVLINLIKNLKSNFDVN